MELHILLLNSNYFEIVHRENQELENVLQFSNVLQIWKDNIENVPKLVMYHSLSVIQLLFQ